MARKKRYAVFAYRGRRVVLCGTFHRRADAERQVRRLRRNPFQPYSTPIPGTLGIRGGQGGGGHA